ncbi:MAG: type II/IV secretion system protein [Kiritimatiellae bacterium]|nr:type II/IV secretion system protein [Kiritimatiellia bacterium]
MPAESMLLPLLDRTGLFAPGETARLVSADRAPGEGLVAAAVRLGMAREEDLLRKSAEALGMEYVDVSERPLAEEVAAKLPARAVTQYRVVPVSWENGVLAVAVSEPFDPMLADALRIAAGCDVALCVCTREKIIRQSNKVYGVGADTLARMAEDGTYAVDADADKSNKFDLEGGDQEASIVRFVNQIIAEGDRQGATDIHFEPMEGALRIRYRVDGLLHVVDVPPQLHRLQAAVISRIKVMAGLDIAEKRLPGDGRIGIRANGKEIDIRVATCPTVYGEKVVLRLLQKGGNVIRLEQLGFEERDDRVVRHTIERPNGIMLVTGPTGSGKSTSLYAFLHQINTPDKNIMTAEDPVEYEMAGIMQVPVKPDIGLTFARVLRSFLRQDPDVIMVGEIRDRETAEIAINASLTGHLVFSTLHTNDSAGAFARLIDMGVEPFLVSSSVVAVLAQRLVRRLCPACKKEGPPDPRLVAASGERPGFFDGRAVWTPVGCQLCNTSGYKGRGGIFEVLHVSDAVRSLVTAHRPSSEIRAKAVEEGMSLLRDDGWAKVFKGFTSMEEVLRVTEDSEE